VCVCVNPPPHTDPHTAVSHLCGLALSCISVGLVWSFGDPDTIMNL